MMNYIIKHNPDYCRFRSQLFDSLDEANQYATKLQDELKREWLSQNESRQDGQYTDDPHTVDVLVYPAQVVSIEETEAAYVGRFDGMDAVFYAETEQECKDSCEEYFCESSDVFSEECHLIFKEV